MRAEVVHDRKWVTAGSGLQPEVVTADGMRAEVVHDRKWITAGSGLQPEVVCGRK